MLDDAKAEADRLFDLHGDNAVFVAGGHANKAFEVSDAATFRYWASVVTHLKEKIVGS